MRATKHYLSAWIDKKENIWTLWQSCDIKTKPIIKSILTKSVQKHPPAKTRTIQEPFKWFAPQVNGSHTIRALAERYFRTDMNKMWHYNYVMIKMHWNGNLNRLCFQQFWYERKYVSILFKRQLLKLLNQKIKGTRHH